MSRTISVVTAVLFALAAAMSARAADNLGSLLSDPAGPAEWVDELLNGAGQTAAPASGLCQSVFIGEYTNFEL